MLLRSYANVVIGGEHIMLPRTVDWHDLARKTPLCFTLHLIDCPTDPHIPGATYSQLVAARIQRIPLGLSPESDFICSSAVLWDPADDRRPRAARSGARRDQARSCAGRDRASPATCVELAIGRADLAGLGVTPLGRVLADLAASVRRLDEAEALHLTPTPLHMGAAPLW